MFAIRHKPTGGFITSPTHRSRAATMQEPSTSRPPRLFSTKGAAKASLRYYCQGHFVRDQGSTGDGEWDWSTIELQKDAAGQPIFRIGDAYRARGDYEILPVTLSFGEPV